MKSLMIGLALTLCASLASAADFCAQYENHKKHPEYIQAIEIVAKRMQYSKAELCNLSRLADIYVTSRLFYNEKNEPEPHTWVTLHYVDYSCQYFVRNADGEVTRKNCYNTF